MKATTRRERRRPLLSGAFLGKPLSRPTGKVLDTAVTKVGQDFPALGALVRLGWTASA